MRAGRQLTFFKSRLTVPGTIMRHTTFSRSAAALSVAAVLLVPMTLTLRAQRGDFTEPVKVQGGLVSGVPGAHPGITAFKGVPFAAPPVGDKRWQAPQPPMPWTGVRKAAAFGPSCIQTVVAERKPWTYEFMTHGEVSEDCLFVNIWTPAKSPSERKPVFVYIYGGGNNEGSGMVPVYDGEGLASKGYFWNHVLPGPDAAQYGAFHTSEVPYVLNTLEQSKRPFTEVDRKIADVLSSYWANFATSGDPNGKGLPAWPAADAKTWMTMELSERPHPIPVADTPAKQAFLERALARR